MVRDIVGAVVGYVAMVAVAMGGIGLAWMLLGGAGAFDGEGPYPSTAWLVGNLFFGFVAALVGGCVARKIGSSLSAVKLLVVLLLVVGGWLAISAESNYEKREPVNKPVAEMTFTEAGRHARQPAWYNFIIPVIGVAGAVVGGYWRPAKS